LLSTAKLAFRSQWLQSARMNDEDRYALLKMVLPKESNKGYKAAS